MMQIVNTRRCRSMVGLLQASNRVIHDFACRGGLATVLTISGCAGRVEPQIQYVRIEVPVQVPCRAPQVTVPPWAAAVLSKTDSLEVKVRALLAERRQRIGYEKQLIAASEACQW